MSPWALAADFGCPANSGPTRGGRRPHQAPVRLESFAHEAAKAPSQDRRAFRHPPCLRPALHVPPPGSFRTSLLKSGRPSWPGHRLSKGGAFRWWWECHGCLCQVQCVGASCGTGTGKIEVPSPREASMLAKERPPPAQDLGQKPELRGVDSTCCLGDGGVGAGLWGWALCDAGFLLTLGTGGHRPGGQGGDFKLLCRGA